MQQLPRPFWTLVAIAIALLLFVTAGLVGGPEFGRDVFAIHSLAAEREGNSRLTSGAIVITEVGGAQGMMIILAISLGLLAVAKRWRDGLALVGIVIGGRIAIELLKLAIDRPRPFFGPYPVEISSLSFPSGHAGNSMITFLALAFIAAPERWRMPAITAAVLASVAIGATRPLLGVHWPTDVIGGWSLGTAWVVALVALTDRWRRAAK